MWVPCDCTGASRTAASAAASFVGRGWSLGRKDSGACLLPCDQIWIAGHRVDLLIARRLVLQIDGGHHVGHQRDLDNAHDAELALLGYHVIRVGFDQIVNHWEVVQDLIMRSVAQGLHLAG